MRNHESVFRYSRSCGDKQKSQLRHRSRRAFGAIIMAKQNHFWQGEWIGDEELEKRIKDISLWINPQLVETADITTLLAAAESMGTALIQDHKSIQPLRQCL